MLEGEQIPSSTLPKSVAMDLRNEDLLGGYRMEAVLRIILLIVLQPDNISRVAI